MEKIKLATRGSPLALKQTEMALEFIAKKFPNAQFDIVEIKTLGDKRLDWSLEKFGGSGLFTKEVEDAVLSGAADIAVHSAKDLPTDTAKGLDVFGFLPRKECRDVMAIRADVDVPSLIASGSPRRRAQLKKIFPQAVWTEIRGNVETRLKKILSGAADATVLSEAGIVRLGLQNFEGIKFVPLKLDICVPAVAQGIIALECRAADAEKFSSANDKFSAKMFAYERRFLESLGGGCQVAYAANFDGENFRFFHEASGYQNIKFAQNTSEETAFKMIDEIAGSLK